MEQQDKKDIVSEETKKLREKIEMLKEKVCGLEKEKNSLEEESAKMVEESERMEEQAELLSEKADEIDDLIDELEDKISELEDEIFDLEYESEDEELDVPNVIQISPRVSYIAEVVMKSILFVFLTCILIEDVKKGTPTFLLIGKAFSLLVIFKVISHFMKREN